MDRREAEGYLRHKLAEREATKAALKYALWRERVDALMNNDYTVKMQYQGFMVEVTTQLKKPEDLAQWLKDMADAGYSKPVYERKEKAEIEPQAGTVAAVTLSTRKFNGKPMYDVVVNAKDGKQFTVQKFNKTEFRDGDAVWCFMNDKGYADITLDFPEGKDIPF